jgi:hypothetical protein
VSATTFGSGTTDKEEQMGTVAAGSSFRITLRAALLLILVSALSVNGEKGKQGTFLARLLDY